MAKHQPGALDMEKASRFGLKEVSALVTPLKRQIVETKTGIMTYFVILPNPIQGIKCTPNIIERYIVIIHEMTGNNKRFTGVHHA